MAASGFFLGGFAQGKAARDALDIKEREVGVKEQDSETKAAGLLQTRDNLLRTEADKAINQSLSFVTSVITESRKAGAPPETVRAKIDPVLQDIDKMSRGVGRDPQPIFRQVDALLGIPAVPDAAATPTTEIGKVRYDLQKGFITQPEADSRIARLTRDVGEPNIIENIRRKIAVGEVLSPGEKQVYDDALKADPIARLIAGSLGQRPTTPVVPAAPARPDPMRVR